MAGACGLVNLGNTCYLNSAVQCLSHTPLVRAYLLSDMWAAEVNKYNPLGTQVRKRGPQYRMNEMIYRCFFASAVDTSWDQGKLSRKRVLGWSKLVELSPA